VYLEAMACGLPVVACEGSGAAEVVIPDENGLLVAPGKAADLATAIGRLLGDDAWREQLARQARSYVVSEHDSELCLDRLEKLYLNVVDAR
jgi:glycosyltransferase involved in cell wall biosynthesis